MSLEIRETDREGVAILALKGRLTVGEASALREKITRTDGKGPGQDDPGPVAGGLHRFDRAWAAW